MMHQKSAEDETGHVCCCLLTTTRCVTMNSQRATVICVDAVLGVVRMEELVALLNTISVIS